MDYNDYNRGRSAMPLDEYDEEAYAKAYGKASVTPGAADSVPGIRPAHPLPARRANRVDYDRYLEKPKSKSQIFLAENRRKRRRSILIGAGLALFVIATVVIIVAILNG